MLKLIEMEHKGKHYTDICEKIHAWGTKERDECINVE